MVPELDQITAVENEHSRPGAPPRLGDAHTMLEARWRAGKRDLETGLRLMFLAWWAVTQPPYLTGMGTQEGCGKTFREVFDYFGGTAAAEPELLYAVEYICSRDPWFCDGAGAEAAWSEVAVQCGKAARQLKPEGYPAEHFEARGTYGEYFAHIARSDPEAQ